MGVFDSLPYKSDLDKQRRATPKHEIKTRLEEKTDKRKSEDKAEAKWKAAVWKRDDGVCRWCGCKVAKTIQLIPNRGEVHHVSGRVVAEIRWDVRNGLLVCFACHQRLTGKVGEKFLAYSKHTFAVDGVRYLDANKPVRFKRVA